MKIFSKEETIVVLLIFMAVGLVSYFNFKDALLRARDTTRRDDIAAVANALGQFYEDYGYFPPSQDGKIKYCKGDNFEELMDDIQDEEQFDRNKFFEGLRECEWGEDQFDDLLDDEYGPYLKKLPRDPKAAEGLSYHYISNTRRFQLLIHQEEGSSAQGFNEGLEKREILCGVDYCNYGRSFAETPLDMSLEEYERQLEQERLENNR